MALGWAALATTALSAYEGHNADTTGAAGKAAQFSPFNLRTGLGETGFSRDAGGQTWSGYANLSPEYQDLRNRYLNLTKSTLDQAAAYNQQGTTASALAQLRGLALPEENRRLADTQSRLFSQGRLGAGDAGGANPEMKAFYDSLNQADQARQLQAIGLGNTQLDSMLSRGQGLFGSFAGIDEATLAQLKTGLYGGSAAALSNIAQAGYINKGGQNEAAFWNSIGQTALSYNNGGNTSLFGGNSGGLFAGGISGTGTYGEGNFVPGLFGSQARGYGGND